MPSSSKFVNQTKYSQGFSLVELMVVIAIVGILATGIIMMFTDPIARVKAQAFEIRGDFNLARAVAVKENEDVLVDFLIGANDGYTICFDTTGVNGCSDEPAEEIIKEVTFRDDVQFYDFSGGGAFPANGPTKYPDGTLMDAATNSNDGVSFAGDNITFESNGSCDKAGCAVIYFPLKNTPGQIRGKPYALVVASASTGKMELRRWRPERPAGPPDERWSRK